jgi:glucose-1-phosphate adenylyltransferase
MAVLAVRRSQASRLGIVRLDDSHRLVELVEKPQTPQQLDALRAPADWLRQRGLSEGREHLANMGIYACRREFLAGLLRDQPQAVDLVTELFARHLGKHHFQAHLFDGYWQDLGTVKVYHEASLALASDDPPFDFHSPEGIIYTRMRNLPASQVRAARLEASLVSDGCVIQPGTKIERCSIGLRCRIGRDVTLRDAVVNGSDRYELEAEREGTRRLGQPALGIGDRCVIERAILDKDCRIGSDVRIVNQRGLRDAEGENYLIRDGVVVIPKGAVVPDGTVI